MNHFYTPGPDVPLTSQFFPINPSKLLAVCTYRTIQSFTLIIAKKKSRGHLHTRYMPSIHRPTAQCSTTSWTGRYTKKNERAASPKRRLSTHLLSCHDPLIRGIMELPRDSSDRVHVDAQCDHERSSFDATHVFVPNPCPSWPMSYGFRKLCRAGERTALFHCRYDQVFHRRLQIAESETPGAFC